MFSVQLPNVAFAMYQAPLPLIPLKQQTVKAGRVPEALASLHLYQSGCVLCRSGNVMAPGSWGRNTEGM